MVELDVELARRQSWIEPGLTSAVQAAGEWSASVEVRLMWCQAVGWASGACPAVVPGWLLRSPVIAASGVFPGNGNWPRWGGA